MNHDGGKDDTTLRTLSTIRTVQSSHSFLRDNVRGLFGFFLHFPVVIGPEPAA
ncbi:hypothetical protein Isop_0574 [Isosphaera pallida ATCC 43644]|uniref:Uncharacterized protein n=1 Tax=Isosphaera pallida (strain ATCC 43644 / DSM 9630 / IS1B) TaxID=575540 RepID=E8R049_ISOPI|nr:hypothetical protein Isop_0574 [Isosphaera pallida ATCC 43644]